MDWISTHRGIQLTVAGYFVLRMLIISRRGQCPSLLTAYDVFKYGCKVFNPGTNW